MSVRCIADHRGPLLFVIDDAYSSDEQLMQSAQHSLPIIALTIALHGSCANPG
jgi:hypothetical protein